MFFKMNPNLDPLPKTIILPFLQKDIKHYSYLYGVSYLKKQDCA